MSQARGSQSAIAIYDETTYGEAPNPASGRRIHVVSCAVAASQPLTDSETLTTQRARAKPARGNIDVSGGITCELHAESMSHLLRHAMGAVQTQGAGPYTHVLTLGALPVGFTLEKDFGANVSGNARYEQLSGCRVGAVAFTFPQQGFPRAEFTIRGAKQQFAAAALDADPEDGGCAPFSAFEAAIEEGGAPIAVVTEAQLNLDNGLDESGYAIGGQGVRRNLAEGFATVSGQITAMFESDALLSKAAAGTESSLKITLSRGTGDGSEGNESIEFFVQQLIYERASPAIQGPAGVLVTLPFRAYRGAANTGFQITIKNALSTI